MCYDASLRLWRLDVHHRYSARGHESTWHVWLGARLLRVKERGKTKKKTQVGRRQLSCYMDILDSGERDVCRMKAKLIQFLCEEKGLLFLNKNKKKRTSEMVI